MSFLYRQGVGIILLNKDGKIFAGNRVFRELPPDFDKNVRFFEMPQGGIEDSETVEECFWRELEEEVGLNKTNVSLSKIMKNKTSYDIPSDYLARDMKGKYVGQQHIWVLCSLIGSESDINIDTENKEFASFQWLVSSEILEKAPFFKKDVYKEVFDYFSL